MAIATILSRAQYGMDAPLVRVEVDIANGLPTFTLVGLPETVVRESKDRVRAAIVNSNFEFPAGRITVNLAPADLPKEGGRFDLPIAIGILVASGQLSAGLLENCEFYGELSLGGELRPIVGILSASVAATHASHALVAPFANAQEATLVNDCVVFAGSHLLEICAHLSGLQPLGLQQVAAPVSQDAMTADLADVRGQAQAKRALEIAAAGEHSLLLIGPPGTGKSMLAQRLPGILPPMSDAEALETATIRSILGRNLELGRWRGRPFRSPHHTASAIALVGGGSQPRPGEISLAHNGVLFLDELPEFDRRVLESLREPLETGSIMVSRAARQTEFPARFQLLAAMNPCPCGHLGEASARCRCTAEQVQRYRARISGPLLDRLDMHVEVPRLAADSLAEVGPCVETSRVIAERVQRARNRQLKRQQHCNARLVAAEVERFCQGGAAVRVLLSRAMQRFGLSARAYHRILKVARTIADLEGCEHIATAHVGEAITLRCLDREAK